MTQPPWNAPSLWSQYHRYERKVRRAWRVMNRTGYRRGIRDPEKLFRDSTKWFNKMMVTLKKLTGNLHIPNET